MGAEIAAAAARERLLEERLAVNNVVQLTELDQVRSADCATYSSAPAKAQPTLELPAPAAVMTGQPAHGMTASCWTGKVLGADTRVTP